MNFAILLIGGTGSRFKSTGIPKQFIEVYGKPIFIYTLERFFEHKEIDKIILVCNPKYTQLCQKYIKKFISDYESIVLIDGGKTRNESIKNGVVCLSNRASQDDIVIIHDGVRPLICDETITKNIELCKKYGVVATVRNVVESVIVSSGEYFNYNDIADRQKTYSMTSPQSIKFSNLLKLTDNFNENDLDIVISIAKNGGTIYQFIDNKPNFKITTPDDYFIFKAFLDLESSKNIFGI